MLDDLSLTPQELRDLVRDLRNRVDLWTRELDMQSRYLIDALNDRNKFMNENLRLTAEVAALRKQVAATCDPQKPSGISLRTLNPPKQQIGLIML